MVASAFQIQPRRATEFAHHHDERFLKQPAPFQIRDELMHDAIKVGHEHLMNLVIEDVAVPGHPIRDHHKRRAVLDEVARHERVQAECARAVFLFLLRRQLFEVE